MATHQTPVTQDLFRTRLLDRRDVLRGEITSALSSSERDEYTTLADQINDSGDASLADLLADVHYSDVQRDVDEVRDIEAALQRMDEGTYGVCVDCGRRIDPKRLEAQPTAVRCIEDQAKYEREHAERPPTL